MGAHSQAWEGCHYAPMSLTLHQTVWTVHWKGDPYHWTSDLQESESVKAFPFFLQLSSLNLDHQLPLFHVHHAIRVFVFWWFCFVFFFVWRVSLIDFSPTKWDVKVKF